MCPRPTLIGAPFSTFRMIVPGGRLATLESAKLPRPALQMICLQDTASCKVMHPRIRAAR
jgi:hypothetical protein